MTISDERLKELAQQMAETLGVVPRKKPELLLVRRGVAVPLQKKGFDAQTRDVMYSRIRDLAKMYWLAWLVRQETVHVSGAIECLTDDDLSGLLQKMERARECHQEGISFDEAGLVRQTIDAA